MAETEAISLFRSEKWAVSMYRIGLIFSALSLGCAAACLAYRVWSPQGDLGGEMFIPMGNAALVSKLFISSLVNLAGGVGLAMIFLSMRQLTLLRVLQIAYIPGLVLLVAATISVSQRYGAGPFSQWGSTVGVAWMLVFYAILAVREATSNKMLEGWLVAAGSLLLAVLLFLSNVPPVFSFWAFAIVAVLGLLMSLRKLAQPLAVDVLKGE